MRAAAAFLVVVAAQAQLSLVPSKTELPNAFCSPCVQLGSQGINLLLNYLLNAGVVESCSKLCEHLKTKPEQLACNLACDLVGIKEFVKALNHTDLDPIYLCEIIKACPAGPDDADASILDVKATPTSVAKGDTVQMMCDVKVAKASGVGEFRLAVKGPVTADVGQSFLLPKGLKEGTEQLAVQLEVKDDTSGDEPVVWSPGLYTFEFEVCQGECGSKHPHSKVFGKIAGNFTLKDSKEKLAMVI
mmetsp:Transcript_78859/g.189278  ORF Transcript_78859/g.189278 Transcript_78859/m.189278 type:complete len:245 (+) Transcript_78859:57-791(+)